VNTTHDHTLRSLRAYPGQRLTAGVLNDSADAERERRWLHNRLLHGFGITFGFEVSRGAGDTTVVVGPGHAIDAEGRDLVLDHGLEIQVPPVAAGVFTLVCRWSDTVRETSTGPCGAVGESLRHEVPDVSFQPGPVAGGVVLATATVEGCMLADLGFGNRKQLDSAPVPYVNGGRHRPPAGDWSELRLSTSGPVVGLQVEVDTSPAGFFGNVSYTARVMGPRFRDGWVHVLCLDEFVISGAATSFRLGVVILADAVTTAGGFDPVSLGAFTAAVQRAPTDLPELLGWSVSWLGTEGSR
jgi:hypothetical protein